jgi:hypothetical protein
MDDCIQGSEDLTEFVVRLCGVSIEGPSWMGETFGRELPRGADICMNLS